jgi:hypothetical protein
MANRGSNLEKNPFEKAMKSSMGNACEISSKVLQALESQVGVDIRIADEITYLEPIDTLLQQGGIYYNASFESRVGDTQSVKDFEKTIPTEVRVWWRMLTDVDAEGTDRYNTLWGHGNIWFYNHSRTTNLLHMNALVTNIGTDTTLAALKTRVIAFIGLYQGKINNQSGEKTEVKTDSSSFSTAVANSSDALFIVYCGLVRIFSGDMTKVLAFFPMELIYKASKMREYRKLIPSASRRKICSRAWKATDKIKLQNNRAIDLNIGFAENINAPVAHWYTLAASDTVIVSPSDIGITTLKALIVQNNDIATQGDITVTVIEA